jgi:hypothetical protein
VPALALAATPLVGQPGAWRASVALALPLCALYAFICLAAWYPAQGSPPGTPIARLLVVQLVAATVASAAWLAIGRGWALLVDSVVPGAARLFHSELPVLATAGILLWLLAAAASFMLLAGEAQHEAERHALEAQVAAREAELRALRAQLDPHFLFNALNSVSALIPTNPGGARGMCEQLSSFLRGALELDRARRIPLGRELELVQSYLQIERVRFGDRLRFLLEVDDAATAVEVPPLLLQPLVENALKHGIAQLVDGGIVSLQAKRRRDTLYVVVENPCDPDAAPSAARGHGIGVGLENVRRRVAATYGESGLVAVDHRPDRFRVELRLPAP